MQSPTFAVVSPSVTPHVQLQTPRLRWKNASLSWDKPPPIRAEIDYPRRDAREPRRQGRSPTPPSAPGPARSGHGGTGAQRRQQTAGGKGKRRPQGSEAGEPLRAGPWEPSARPTLSAARLSCSPQPRSRSAASPSPSGPARKRRWPTSRRPGPPRPITATATSASGQHFRREAAARGPAARRDTRGDPPPLAVRFIGRALLLSSARPAAVRRGELGRLRSRGGSGGKTLGLKKCVRVCDVIHITSEGLCQHTRTACRALPLLCGQRNTKIMDESSALISYIKDTRVLEYRRHHPPTLSDFG